MIPRPPIAVPTALLTRTAVVATLAFGLLACGSHRSSNAGMDGMDGPRGAKATELKVGALRALKDTPFERSWDLALGHPVHKAWISPNIDNLIFFQLDETFEIVAVDTMSGHTRWVSKPLPEGMRLDAYATRDKLTTDRPDVFTLDERLYAVAQDTLFCFDCATGHLIWRYELPFSPSTGPTVVGHDDGLRVYLGDWAGRLQAVSWHMTREFPFPAWQWNLATSATAGGATKDDILYFADHNGTVAGYKPDRQQTWSTHLGGAIYGAPALRDRTLFVGTSGNTLHALNRLTGETLGQINVNGPITKAPMVFRNKPDQIYTWVDGPVQTAGLYAFTAENDTVPYTDTARHPLEVVRMGLRWSVPGLTTLVSSTPAFLYATDGSPVIQAVNRDSGQVDWRWDVNAERLKEQEAQGVRRPAKVSQLASYVDSTDLNRSIYAIDEAGGVVSYRFFGFVPSDHVNVTTAEGPVKKAKAAEATPPKDGEAPAAAKP